MATRIYWVHTFENSSKLGIMARPRGGEWLEDEIKAFAKSDVNCIVSLLEANEITELELQREPELCMNNSIEFINFSIRDRNVPKSEIEIKRLVGLLSEKLREGLNIVIHCRMGIGRSSIIAGSVLKNYGQKVDIIIQNISKIRGINVPDTIEQRDWLNKQKFD